MKWVGRLLTSAAAVLLTTGGGVKATTHDGHVSSAEAAWTETVKVDTLEAYAAFAMQYPESEHAQAAYAALSGGKSAAMTFGAMAGDDSDLASEPGFEPRHFRIA